MISGKLDAMNLAFQTLFTSTTQLFTTPLFYLGETPISLNSILQLILWLLLIFILCRALRIFLKNRLLTKLGIDEGNREAIATIISYAIGTISVIVVLQTTGFKLASLAVLAGGLGVGIGFGLQDATKNFVSGLNLLLERKIKVGDFVEFDSLSGYVKEIAIRSTIIRTQDGGDVVVPNSQLVENRILNWSYDSFKARIHVPVGVEYGSDPIVVTESLLNSAYMEPAVLGDPPPKVLFVGFGDSSLNFELWVWVARIDHEPFIKSSLNFTIEYNLRQQGISIPFHQTDVWIRNPESLLPAVHPQTQEPGQLPPSAEEKKGKPLALRYLLQQVTYFQNFTDLELRKLIEIGYRKRLKIGEILFKEGDPGDGFYIILSGSVEVFVQKIDKHLTNLSAGKFLGELSLMLGIPRTATVRALEDTILFAIDSRGFKFFLQEHPEIAEEIIRELSRHQEELTERQKQLREMGLVDANEDDKNPILWVRKRLKNLFGL